MQLQKHLKRKVKATIKISVRSEIQEEGQDGYNLEEGFIKREMQKGFIKREMREGNGEGNYKRINQQENEKDRIHVDIPSNNSDRESNKHKETLAIRSKYLKRAKKMSARLNEQQRKQLIKQAKKIVSYT